jgi:hypothetical protein
MPRPARQLAAPPADPFGERRRGRHRLALTLLGGRFHFETDSAQLLRLVRSAFAGLPAQRLADRGPPFRVRLILTPAAGARRGEPPRVRPLAGAGVLCGAMDGTTCASLLPQQRRALLLVSRAALRFPYHVRYELLEFVAYVLAARGLALVPLHAGCLGHAGRALLLCGASGTGKTTTVAHALLAGLELLAEDSVLVRPRGLLATGLASYLHLRPDSLAFLSRAERGALLAGAARIRRRSGVRKFEVDLRRTACRLAPAPLPLCAVVFLSARRRRGRQPLLRPLPREVVQQRLAAQQRYAAQQPGWRSFRTRLARLPAYELCRDQHPRGAVAALRTLLATPARRRAARPR